MSIDFKKRGSQSAGFDMASAMPEHVRTSDLPEMGQGGVKCVVATPGVRKNNFEGSGFSLVVSWDHEVEKPLIRHVKLNQGNNKALRNKLGDWSGDWIGATVLLSRVPTEYRGEATEGIGVEVVSMPGEVAASAKTARTSKPRSK